MFDEASTFNPCDLPAAPPEPPESDVETTRSAQCAICKKAAVKKPATRMVRRGDRTIPMCTWHWNVSKEQLPEPRLAASQLSTASDEPPAIMEEKDTMARPKNKCRFEGCAVMTASKVGYCGKHFYYSKRKSPKLAARCAHAGCEAKVRRDNQVGLCRQHRWVGGAPATPKNTARPRKPAAGRPANGHAEPAGAVATLCLSEAAIDKLLIGMSLELKAQMLENVLALAER